MFPRLEVGIQINRKVYRFAQINIDTSFRKRIKIEEAFHSGREIYIKPVNKFGLNNPFYRKNIFAGKRNLQIVIRISQIVLDVENLYACSKKSIFIYPRQPDMGKQ